MSNPFINTKQVEDYRNTANGFAMLNSEGKLVGPIIPRSGTKAEIDGIVLALGETAYYTDVTGHAVGDGVTAGGWPRLVATLGADVEADSDSYEDVLSLDITGDGSIWEIRAFLAVEAVDVGAVDPGNFKTRVGLAGLISPGRASHPANDAGAADTTAYQTTNGDDIGIGGSSYIALAGMAIVNGASETLKLQLGQVSTGTPTIKALAGKCHLFARRIA